MTLAEQIEKKRQEAAAAQAAKDADGQALIDRYTAQVRERLRIWVEPICTIEELHLEIIVNAYFDDKTGWYSHGGVVWIRPRDYAYIRSRYEHGAVLHFRIENNAIMIEDKSLTNLADDLLNPAKWVKIAPVENKPPASTVAATLTPARIAADAAFVDALVRLLDEYGYSFCQCEHQ